MVIPQFFFVDDICNRGAHRHSPTNGEGINRIVDLDKTVPATGSITRSRIVSRN